MEDKQVLAVELEVVCSVVTGPRFSGSPAYALMFMRI